MACTYNYDTGKLTMDFHLIKDGEICYLRGKEYASRVGAYGCQHCVYNKGGHIDYSGRTLDETLFTKCKHPDAKTSNGAKDVMWRIEKDFISEAITHMYD